jgi:hypothetical protein
VSKVYHRILDSQDRALIEARKVLSEPKLEFGYLTSHPDMPLRNLQEEADSQSLA